MAPPAYADSIGIEEIRRYPLLVREAGSGTRKCFDVALKKKGITPGDMQIVAELGDTQAIKEAVKQGMGVAYLSLRAIAEELKNKSLKVLNVEGIPGVRRSFYTVLKKGRSQSPQVQAFLKTDKRREKTMIRYLWLLISLCLTFVVEPAFAKVSLDIYGQSYKKITIATPPFKSDSETKLKTDMGDLLAKDLDLSGFFIVAPKSVMDRELTEEGIDRKEIRFENWRSLGIELLCKGLLQTQNGGLTFEAYLYDSSDGTLLFAKRYRTESRRVEKARSHARGRHHPGGHRRARHHELQGALCRRGETE